MSAPSVDGARLVQREVLLRSRTVVLLQLGEGVNPKPLAEPSAATAVVSDLKVRQAPETLKTLKPEPFSF